MKIISRATLLIIFIFLLGGVSRNSLALSLTYSISPQNHELGRCGVQLNIPGAEKTKTVVKGPNYLLSFDVPDERGGNDKVKISGKTIWGLPPDNAPACDVKLVLTLNEIIKSEWERVSAQATGSINSTSCLEIGLNYLGIKPFEDLHSDSLIMTPSHPKAQKMLGVCTKMAKVELRKNFDCELSSGIKTRCDEAFHSRTDPQKKLSVEEALVVQFSGEEVQRGIWETEKAATSRLAKADEERAIQEARKRAAEEREVLAEKRRQWLETPEGKKHLEAEALKAKRAAEEKAQVDSRERARIAKEFPFYAVLTCGMGQDHMTILGCFGERGKLEIRNGSEYGLYTLFHIANQAVPNSINGRNGLTINLRHNFSLDADNRGDLTLGVKIFERGSGRLLFEKQAIKYGQVKVRNEP